MLEQPHPPKSLRMLIVDDHSRYREGLAESLRDSGIEVIDAVPTAEAALPLVESEAPDVVIMDIHLPGISGLAATRRVKEQGRATQVLVISVSADDADVADAIAAGASGYLPKDRPVEEIISWGRAVAAGEQVVSPRIASALLRRVRDADEAYDPGAASLSIVEIEVLELLAEGSGMAEIAHRLGFYIGSIHNRVASALMKLQVPDGRARGRTEETH